MFRALQLSLDVPADTESLHNDTAKLEAAKKEKDPVARVAHL